MTESKQETKYQIDTKEFITYYCPHCEKAFAKGILLSVKIICPNCNEFFVMVGLDKEEKS